MRRLILRPGAIGDCILALPAMEFLKTAYTEVWAPSPVLPLMRFADRVQPIAGSGLDLLEIPDCAAPRRLLETLAGFDSIVSWYGANRQSFRDATEDLPIQFLPALPGPGDRVHCADFFALSTGAPQPAIPRIPCPFEPPAEPYCVIHPFSGSPVKNWPLDRYREVARNLPFPVRWCAGPDEHLEDAVRFDNLYSLACWIAASRLYLGNDSGITHLAAASGAPVAAIFVATDPLRWAPRGPNVVVIGGPAADLPVESVLAAARRLDTLRVSGPSASKIRLCRAP